MYYSDSFGFDLFSLRYASLREWGIIRAFLVFIAEMHHGWRWWFPMHHTNFLNFTLSIHFF